MSYPLQQGQQEKEYKSQPLNKEEKSYYDFVVKRLVSAMNARDMQHDEFDSLSFLENFVYNRRMRNSYLPPRKNPTDVSVVTGDAHIKAKAIAAALVKMNLETDVLAFDYNENEDAQLGYVLKNLIKKSKELDNDEEKLLDRIYALLEQGTVHIGETWTPTIRKNKKILNPSALDPATGFAGLKWEEEEIVDYKCERRLYSNLEVYPGNIKQYEIEKQPYIYRRIIMDYVEASTIFGNFKNWEFVMPGGTKVVQDGSDNIPYGNFSLYELDGNQVEVIYYEDLPNREYQIFVGGVMMLPPHFPMPWSWNGYSMIKQVLDPINNEFYYGRSLMADLRFGTEVLDRILQMLINKTHQSIKPPSANNTGKMLGPRIFDPGQMINGVDANRIQSLVNHQGVTNSEWAMYQELKKINDSNSVSQVFSGGMPPGTQTATAVLEGQRQSQMMLAPILWSVALMEQKADWLRVYNILANWTKPVDKRVDPIQKKLVDKYRSVTIAKTDVGGKMGNLKIEMMDKVPTQQERKAYSYKALTEEMSSKNPTKSMRLILPILEQMKYRFFLKCNPADRPGDNLNKVLFREMMDQAFSYFGPDQINMDYFKKRWALTWGENPEEVISNFSMKGMQDILNTQNAQAQVQEATPADSEGAGMGPAKSGNAGMGITGGMARVAGKGGKKQIIANV